MSTKDCKIVSTKAPNSDTNNMNANNTVHTNHFLNKNAAPTCLDVSIRRGLDKSECVLKAIETIYTNKIRKSNY